MAHPTNVCLLCGTLIVSSMPMYGGKQRKYCSSCAEKIVSVRTELQRKHKDDWHTRFERWRSACAAEHAERRKENLALAAKIKTKVSKGNNILKKHRVSSSSDAIQLLADKKALLECPRLKLRATSLPCGNHVWCSGCEKLPEGTRIDDSTEWSTPYMDF